MAPSWRLTVLKRRGSTRSTTACRRRLSIGQGKRPAATTMNGSVWLKWVYVGEQRNKKPYIWSQKGEWKLEVGGKDETRYPCSQLPWFFHRSEPEPRPWETAPIPRSVSMALPRCCSTGRRNFSTIDCGSCAARFEADLMATSGRGRGVRGGVGSQWPQASSWRSTVLKGRCSTGSTAACQRRKRPATTTMNGSVWQVGLLWRAVFDDYIWSQKGEWKLAVVGKDESRYPCAVVLPPRWRTRDTAMHGNGADPAKRRLSKCVLSKALQSRCRVSCRPTGHGWSLRKLRLRTFKRQDTQCCETVALGWFRRSAALRLSNQLFSRLPDRSCISKEAGFSQCVFPLKATWPISLWRWKRGLVPMHS